jgi:hypothetical protein
VASHSRAGAQSGSESINPSWPSTKAANDAWTSSNFLWVTRAIGADPVRFLRALMRRQA